MFEIDEKIYALYKGEIDKNQEIIKANKAKKAPFFYARQNYAWYRERLDIDEKAVLLEALDGAAPTGNVAALVRELNDNPEYAEYKLYLSGINWSPSKNKKRVTFLNAITDLEAHISNSNFSLDMIFCHAKRKERKKGTLSHIFTV